MKFLVAVIVLDGLRRLVVRRESSMPDRNRRHYVSALLWLIAPMAFGQSDGPKYDPFVPDTVSVQAQARLKALEALSGQQSPPPVLGDLEGWRKFQGDFGAQDIRDGSDQHQERAE
jgi:hypothetical protein